MKRFNFSPVVARFSLGVAAFGLVACGNESGSGDPSSAGSRMIASGSGGGGALSSGGAGTSGGKASGGSGAGNLGGNAGTAPAGGAGNGSGGATSGSGGGDSGGQGGTGGGAGGAPGGPEGSLGFIGCSMAENVAQGYQAVGGKRLWPPYGTGALVVQEWTDTNSAAWDKFDAQSDEYGKPTAVWVQICIFAQDGANYDEVKQLIANARAHAADGATIYISGQPLYEEDWVCFLAGDGGPELTDELAQQAGNDATLNVTYAGTFGPLGQTTTPGGMDNCHANMAGQQLLGNQAKEKFGP